MERAEPTIMTAPSMVLLPATIPLAISDRLLPASSPTAIPSHRNIAANSAISQSRVRPPYTIMASTMTSAARIATRLQFSSPKEDRSVVDAFISLCWSRSYMGLSCGFFLIRMA